MKHGSTIFLRITVAIMGLIAIGLCLLILPAIHREWSQEYPDVAYLKYPVLAGLSVTVIPFFVALFQTLKLLNYIDKNKVFTLLAVNALKVIKYCAFVFSGLYALSLPVVYYIAQIEDAPGLVVIGLAFTGAPFVIGVFAGVFQGLLQSAIDIKSENDLTV